jgi:outer membrane biogenesis lipoprotein LolB
MNKYTSILTGYVFCSAVLLLASCATPYPYDPENPQDYADYWKNQDKLKENTLIYPYSEECKEEKQRGASCLF